MHINLKSWQNIERGGWGGGVFAELWKRIINVQYSRVYTAEQLAYRHDSQPVEMCDISKYSSTFLFIFCSSIDSIY